jgi:hypothetical protein
MEGMSRLSNLGLGALTVLLCILAFEGAARVAGWVPGPWITSRPNPQADDLTWSAPDPDLGWVNKPGTSRSNEPGEALMSFSADGSRFSPLLPAKRNAPLNVLLVGCSFTQGYGVADDETFLHFLNERFPDIRFESFGTGGYNTLQATIMAERALRRVEGQDPAPLLVIYGFIPDHMNRNVGQFRTSLTDASGRHYIFPPHARLRGSELELHAYTELDPWPLERQSVILSLLHKTWIRYGRSVTQAEARQVTTRLVEQFAQTVRARGSLPLMAVLTRDADAEAPSSADSLDVLDCAHPDWGKDPALRTGGGTGHPSSILHRHFADCIGDYIERNLPALRSPTAWVGDAKQPVGASEAMERSATVGESELD